MSGRTVKVRIAVAFNAAGGFAAVGADGRADDRATEDALCEFRAARPKLSEEAHCLMVTATLPVPEPVEVEAEVEAPERLPLGRVNFDAIVESVRADYPDATVEEVERAVRLATGAP